MHKQAPQVPEDSSTLRAFGVLELVARADGPLSLDEVTQLCGLPKPSVYRILGTLQRGGLVQREPAAKRYCIGARLSRLALEVMMRSPQRARRHAILQQLVAEIGETCNLTMLDGNEVLYLDRVETSSPVRVHLAAGSRVPLHCTASGKLFLSQLSDSQAATLLGPGPYRRFTENTITDPAELQKALRRIRSEGMGTDVSEFLEGSVAVSVPVTDAQGRVCATVAVHGPAPRVTLRSCMDFLPALRRAATAMAGTMVPQAAAEPGADAPAAKKPAKPSTHGTAKPARAATARRSSSAARA
ncbi:MAG: IclR family transcriptional regulator [Rhodocyclales bacterium]|nr:IclR family transcriptional regulator [Rhodocyclales bacterium]